jgi:hypothetical protein
MKAPSAMPIPLDIPPSKGEIEDIYYKYAGSMNGDGTWDKFENYEYLELDFDYTKNLDNKAFQKLITLSIQSQFNDEAKLNLINAQIVSLTEKLARGSMLFGIFNLRGYISYLEKNVLENIQSNRMQNKTGYINEEIVENVKSLSTFEKASIEYFAKSPLKVAIQSEYFFDLISGTHQEGAYQIVKSQLSSSSPKDLKAAKTGLVKAIKAFYGNYYISNWQNCLKMLFDEAYKIAINQEGITEQSKIDILKSYNL